MAAGHQRLKEEKEFYDSMDRSVGGSCCTCSTMIIFFVVLFALCATGAYYLAKRITISRPHKSTQEVKLLSPAFEEKDASNKIELSERDLQSLIWGGSRLLIPLSGKKVDIEPKGIILSGRIPGSNRPIGLLLKPVVKGGQVIVDKVSLQQGPKEFGDEFASPIKSAVSESLNDALKQRSPKAIEKIELRQGIAVIQLRN